MSLWCLQTLRPPVKSKASSQAYWTLCSQPQLFANHHLSLSLPLNIHSENSPYIPAVPSLKHPSPNSVPHKMPSRPTSNVICPLEFLQQSFSLLQTPITLRSQLQHGPQPQKYLTAHLCFFHQTRSFLDAQTMCELEYLSPTSLT